MLAIGSSDPQERNEQFEFIAAERKRLAALGVPVLSVDTKKKEFLGDLWRPGALYGESPLKRYDHDFPYLAQGKVVPHGIYDLERNEGFMTLGNSAETAEFIACSLKRWWESKGRQLYGSSDRIYILLDAGGANSVRSHQFKLEMLKLAAQTNRIWQVSHYPPYCSKWNPIEHRLFPHVTRAIQGIRLDSAETMRDCIMERATTKAGLLTEVVLERGDFPRGRKTLEQLPSQLPLQRNELFPNWNYLCYPCETYKTLTYLN